MVFYESYYRAAQKLTSGKRLQFYDAIFAFSFDDLDPKLKGEVALAFELVKPVLEKSRKFSDAGKKGVEAKKKQAGLASPLAKPAIY